MLLQMEPSTEGERQGLLRDSLDSKRGMHRMF